MPLHLVFLLRCKSCKTVTVLPRQSKLGRYAGKQYLQSPGVWPVTFGCTYCGQVAQYSNEDRQKESVPALAHNSHSEALWRIEFQCGQPDCGKHYTLYAMYLEKSTLREVAEALASKNPGVLCEHSSGVWQNLKGEKWAY